MKTKNNESQFDFDRYLNEQFRFEKQRNKAIKMDEQGKTFSAIRTLKSILREDPDSIETLYWLGTIYFENGKIDKANKYLHRVFMLIKIISELFKKDGVPVDLLDEYGTMLAKTGWMLHENGEKIARACLKLAVKIAPENIVARYNPGCFYVEK